MSRDKARDELDAVFFARWDAQAKLTWHEYCETYDSSLNRYMEFFVRH